MSTHDKVDALPDARTMLELLVGMKKIKRKIEDGTATNYESMFYQLTKEQVWEQAEQVLAAPSAVADSKPRCSYEPLTEKQIEALRYRFSRGMNYEAHEVGTLCDMAINALLYAQEIDRLRAAPSASGPTNGGTCAKCQRSFTSEDYCPICSNPSEGQWQMLRKDERGT